MKLIIDISKDRYDEIMAMDWVNGRRFFDEELRAIHDGIPQRTERWIPITSRPMTEEEKEHYKTHPEYQDDYRIFNCKLPDDGQEVLISVYGGVEVDSFVQDANDGCYFEGRDIYDVDAWMPLPLPYKQEVEG